MTTRITSSGQVTIPRRIRDTLTLVPGSSVEFVVNHAGDVVMRKAGTHHGCGQDRYEAARGKADVKWRTDDLMVLLRGADAFH